MQRRFSILTQSQKTSTQNPPTSQPQRTQLLRPPAKTTRQKMRDFVWNESEGKCLTRTPANWCAICFYYSLFLGVVILIFYISMLIAIYVAKQNGNRPQYTLNDSPIGAMPSVNFFPFEGSRNLIWLSDRRDHTHYSKVISKVFREYKKKNSTFNTTQFEKCAEFPFGYDEMSPCIFLRMNRIILWKPQPYKRKDKLPENLPNVVKDLIANSPAPKIWITCVGSTPKDRDHIAPDSFQFQGGQGLDVSKYPYDRQEDFIDPIVAVKFNDFNPKNILYSFTCTAWAKKLDPKIAKVDITYYFEH